MIYGDGSVSGGEVSKVRVFGDGTIQTDVVADSIKVYGTAMFNGKVEAEEIKI